VLCAFLKVATQWRVATLGGGLEPSGVYWLGLDYTAVAAGLAGHGIAASPPIWEGLRLMEAAAKNVLNGAAESD
jgi:hypothetical protein